MVKSFKTLLLAVLTISATTAPVYCVEPEVVPSNKTSKVYISHGSRKYAHIVALVCAGLTVPTTLTAIIAVLNRAPEVAGAAAIMTLSLGSAAIAAELKAYFDYYEVEVPRDLELTLNLVNKN